MSKRLDLSFKMGRINSVLTHQSVHGEFGILGELFWEHGERIKRTRSLFSLSLCLSVFWADLSSSWDFQVLRRYLLAQKLRLTSFLCCSPHNLFILSTPPFKGKEKKTRRSWKMNDRLNGWAFFLFFFFSFYLNRDQGHTRFHGLRK